MAATAAVNRPPPAHPGPIGGNLHSHPNSGVPNSAHQDPGLHGPNQDLGPPPHPQHHISTRPVFYIPAPPPPPFLQYQWPMPFSYNPFTGFPGMGYGMVMPPLPPPPYMEAPAYIVPHPHIQPVDYRRLLHPQVHAPSAPYQNPNQNRRIRPPHSVPVRETVSSAVQTEPTPTGLGGYSDRSPPPSSDSGHGTASSSPSSSKSSSQKRDSAEVVNYTCNTNAKNLQVERTCTNNPVKHGFNIPHPTGTNTDVSCIRTTVETQKHHKDSVGHENVPPCRNHHRNMWSVGSSDSMVPVCSSSQQEDGVVKERRVSVPDILMSWGGGTPQVMLKMTDKGLPESDIQLPPYETEVEHDKSVHRCPTENKNDSVEADLAHANDAENVLSSKDSETLFKILKLPTVLHELLSESRRENGSVDLVGSVKPRPPYSDEPLHSLNGPHKLSNDEQENGDETNPHEDTPETIPYHISLNSCQIKKMNESVWSVDSLAPFIPSKEWLLQKSMFEPEIIIEMTEEAENGRLLAQNDHLIDKERRQSRRLSSSDSVPMSDSWLIFSTPTEKLRPSKKPEIESEIEASEMRELQQDQNTAPSVTDVLISQTCVQSKIVSTLTEKDVDDNRSSEPEANESPNQESLIVNEQQEKPCSPEQGETLLVSSVAGEKISQTGPLILLNVVDIEAENGACGNEDADQLSKGQLYVQIVDQRMAQVSPSKGHLVDCGIQFPESEELCMQEESNSSKDLNRRHPQKYSDVKKANGGKAEGFGGNGQKNQKRNNQWRNRGQERLGCQQEAYGYYSKPGKSRGGNGRNPRY